MRIYCNVRTANPPTATQPATVITAVDDDGTEIELFFRTVDSMLDMARVLTDTADEAYRNFYTRRAARAQVREDIARDERYDEDRAYEATVDDARTFNQDDYDWEQAS